MILLDGNIQERMILSNVEFNHVAVEGIAYECIGYRWERVYRVSLS